MAEMVKEKPSGQAGSDNTDKHMLTTINQSMKLSALFSGLKPGKGECTFDLWKYEVECSIKEGVCSIDNQKRMIRASLRGEAAHVLKRLGPDASVASILQKFDDVYGMVETGEETLSEFYSAQQRVDEDASSRG